MDFSVFTKQLCRFLIQRYMGQYLRTELTSDQLELHLADGTASVQGVMLNTEYINETLETSGVRFFSLKDGYVEELTVCVPWKRLLSDSTVVKIRDLQITITPLAEINMTNAQDLVSSFVGSIATSMDLAKSVIVDEQLANGTDNTGIEQCASLIDQIIARIKVVFENVTLRVESYSELCTGIEIQIDRMEFLDEHLEEQLRNISTTITEQPGRLYTVTDLNKLLHIQGVRFYTDIWSPIKERIHNSRMNSSEVEMDADMAGSSINFQSCYSHFSSRSNSNNFRPKLHDIIPPNPVLFAQLFDERNTLRIRVNNNSVLSCAENSFFNKRVDIELFFGGPLYFFLSPSQIALLRDVLSSLMPKENLAHKDNCHSTKIGGIPMGPEQYEKLMEQMQHGNSGAQRAHFGIHNMGQGTWSGADRFYDLSEQLDNNQQKESHNPREQIIKTSENSTEPTGSILPHNKFNRTNSLDSHKGMAQSHRQSSTSISTLVERRPDIFSLSVRAPSLIVVTTHEDPLRIDAIEKKDGEEGALLISSIIQRMNEQADRFFEIAKKLKINRRRLDEQRNQFAELYHGDCLRLVANDFFMTFTLTNDLQRNSLQLDGHLEEVDFIESLWQNELTKALFVDVLNISAYDKRGIPLKTNLFNFQISNTLEKPDDYMINLNMERCKTEIDLSLIDRISNLISIRPFFVDYKHKLKLSESGIQGLNENFIMDMTQRAPTITVKCKCNGLLMDLRIPIANFTTQSPDYRKRNLHPEYLQIEFDDIDVEIPKLSLSDISLYWTIYLKSKTAKGTFVGDPKILQCNKEELTFFYADASNAGRTYGNEGMRLELRYDARNKSLSNALLNNVDTLMAKSLNESIFNPADDDNVDGPFSKGKSYFVTDTTDIGFEKRLIMAGSRTELMDFALETRKKAKIAIELIISRLNIAFPSRKFFEVFYNRFANDLALWEPKSPKLKPDKNLEVLPEKPQFIECQSNFLPFHGTDPHVEPDCEDNENITFKNFPNQCASNAKLVDSHFFTLGFHVGKTQALLQTLVATDEQKNLDEIEAPNLHHFNSQLVAHLIQNDIFLVCGFLEDPNLTYLFLTSKKAELSHKNLFDGANPFCNDVQDTQNFALLRHKKDICIEEAPKDQSFDRVEDDNFAFSMKMHFHPEKNTKDFFIALGLRNCFLHLHPFPNSKYFWATQYTDFFNVVDYGVPGYILPTVNIDLRIHLESTFLGYDHSSIVPTSPYQLRLEIGFSYLTSFIVQDVKRLKFDCIFQDMKMWMCKKPPPTVNFDLPPTTAGPVFNSLNTCSFVKMLECDFIHFIVACTIAIGEVPGPLFDFSCVNKSVTIWLCADTFIEFLNLLMELVHSDTIKKLLSTDEQTEKDQQEQLYKMIEKSNEIRAQKPSGTNTTKNQGQVRKEISLEDEERLIKMMEAAMNDLPNIASRSKRPYLSGINEDIMNDEEECSSNSATTENTDDEFILIEKVLPGRSKPQNSGVTQMSDRFQTKFDIGGDFEFITKQINANTKLTSHLDDLPSNLPTPLYRFKLKEISLNLFLFGGTDFGDTSRTMSQKTYSQWNTNSLDRRKIEDTGSQGGKYRDHTVIVEIQISKLSFASEVFDKNSSVLSFRWLKIDEFKVLDHLSISHINEMIHRLEEEGRPRIVATPFLSIYLIEDQLREAKLRVSLAPIRLNLDQDTIEFLMDFKNDLAQCLRSTFDFPVNPQNIEMDDDIPVMEVAKEVTHENSTVVYPKLNKVDNEFTMSFNELKKADELMTNETTNIEELFSEDDVNLSDSFCANYSSDIPKASSSDNADCEKMQSEPEDEQLKSSMVDGVNPVEITSGLAAKETFIKDFSFSPACRLRIDYEAKRVKTDQQGALIGFLIGMTNLNKTELMLGELRVEKGFLGIEKCVQYAIDAWLLDIRTKQFPNVVGSVAPITALVQLVQGFHDLFALPLSEFRKEDGQVIRGIQRGASSFGLNATTAAIDATQRVVGMVQNVAEVAYDMVNPDFAFQRQRRLLNGPQRVQIAGDIREGLSLAYTTVREGVMDTAQTLQAAAEEDRALGGWGMGILRHMTPSAIKPIVLASKAASQVLGGLKNQLKPEEHREELRKWRQMNQNKTALDHLRRQSSNGSIPSSSTGSFQHREQPHQRRNNWC